MVIASRGRRCTFKDVTATDDHRPMTTKELLALLAYNDREDDPEVYEDWDDWNDGKYTTRRCNRWGNSYPLGSMLSITFPIITSKQTSIRWHQEVMEMSKQWVEEVLSYYSDLSEDEFQIWFLYNELQPLSKLLPISRVKIGSCHLPIPEPIIGKIWVERHSITMNIGYNFVFKGRITGVNSCWMQYDRMRLFGMRLHYKWKYNCLSYL